MKKSILLLLSLVILASCGDKASKKLDPNAVLSIRPAKGVQVRSTEHLTGLQIVEQTLNMEFIAYETGRPSSRGFADAQRDLNPEAPRLKMWGSDIINDYNGFEPAFLQARDIVLTRGASFKYDTIAYIPNKILIEGYPKIKEAYDKGDYETVYKMFDSFYTFIPINHAEYEALREKGEN